MKEMAVAPLAFGPPPRETQDAPYWSGIRALMLAVLADAIHSLSSSQALVRAEAEQWITSLERRYVFSFAVICDTLELEPAAVRRSVMDLPGTKRMRGGVRKRSRPNVRHRGAIQLASFRRSRQSSSAPARAAAAERIDGRSEATAVYESRTEPGVRRKASL